ncbi:MAG: hypothetical protein ACK45S_06305, partial [Sphingobacteriales bacterium]
MYFFFKGKFYWRYSTCHFI